MKSAKIEKDELLSVVRMYKIKIKMNDKPISRLNVEELKSLLNHFHACRKIQKFLRSKWSVDDTCPITLESIKYPFYGHKVGNKFIYYNLTELANYLVDTGDFRDPKTREVYTPVQLQAIDRNLKDAKLTINNVKLKGVYSASRNKIYYRRKKEHDMEILMIERCLDEYISSLRFWIDSDSFGEFPCTDSHLKSYFRRLNVLSKELAISLMKSSIELINRSVDKCKKDSMNMKRDYVITILYNIQMNVLE